MIQPVQNVCDRPSPTSRGARHFGRAVALLAASLLLGTAGCGSLGNAGLGAAQVRFVEVSPGLPQLDFAINDIPAAYGLGYESFTSYLPVNAGAATLSAVRSGSTKLVATADASLTGGKQYTAVLAHVPGGPQEHLFEDQDSPAAPGRISLRVLNEVEGGTALTVYVTPAGAPAATPPSAILTVPPSAASSYVDVPAANGYVLVATEPKGGLNLPVGSSVSLPSVSGAVRTVVFAGTAPAAGRTKVVGFVLADADLP